MEFREASLLVRRLSAIPFFPRDTQARALVGLWLIKTFPDADAAEQFVSIAVHGLEKYHGIPGLRKIAARMVPERPQATDTGSIKFHPKRKNDCGICKTGYLWHYDDETGTTTQVECECTKEAVA